MANEIQGLGAKDITNHEVEKKLLRSLDTSFDTLVLMIQERPNFKSLNSIDVMERLNTHEEQEEEKRDRYGSTQRKNHALKVVADSSSDGNAKEVSDDPEELSKDLALITKRFQHFHKKSKFQKRSSSNSGGSKSSKPTGEYTYFKCKKPGHFILYCPLWEAEIRASGRYESSNYRSKGKRKSYDSDDEKKTRKFFKKKDSSASKSSSRSSSKNPSKSSSNHKSTYHKAKACIGKDMDYEEEEESSASEEENESDEDSDSVNVQLDESNGSQKEHLPNVIDEPLISDAIQQMAIGSVRPVEGNAPKSSDDDAPMTRSRTRQATAEVNAPPNGNGNQNTNADQNGNPEGNDDTNADADDNDHQEENAHPCVSVEDSAKIHSMTDNEEAFMGIADESKAPKGPTVGPSTSKRKRTEQNANEQEADAPKKWRGGRQPIKNIVELVSHDEYNTVPGEDSNQRKGCVQKIQHH
nr:dentin sialophosphoprotein-like [Aegilops tauschii subsp. strangulata]